MSYSPSRPRAARAAAPAACALLLTLLAAAAFAQTPAPPAHTEAPAATPAAVVGTWAGTYHSVPAITLNIKADGAKLSGTAVFYRIVNKGGEERVDGQVEVELLEPKLAGSSLTFKVKPPPPPDMKVEPKAFDMELQLTAADEGVVITRRGSSEEDESGGLTRLKVTRKK